MRYRAGLVRVANLMPGYHRLVQAWSQLLRSVGQKHTDFPVQNNPKNSKSNERQKKGTRDTVSEGSEKADAKEGEEDHEESAEA
jgi:hypothetical protein